MWNYERRLQYPVNITSPNAKIAQIILSQYGGPDGEAAASFRYLSQRYSMPDRKVAGLLTDIGTEELAHLEMVASIVRQLTKGLSAEELEEAGFAPYYVDHTAGIWPQAAGGIPFNACEFQSKGDAITDLFEDMAAEQKARTTYDNILRLVKDPEVCDPIRFLRQREIVHFQRFGEGLRMIQDDFRDVQEAAANGNERAQLALDIFFRRVIAYIGRYFIALGGVDAICFTAGIGENSFFARKEICNLLAEALGIEIDDDANVNGKGDRLISTPNSKVKVYVIPTNEELVIARDTKRLLNL